MGSGTAPSRIGDLYVDTANTNIYFARGSTDGYDWVRQNGMFTTSAAVAQPSAFQSGSTQNGKWAANSQLGDIVVSSGSSTVSFRMVIRTNAGTTLSIGSTGTFTRFVSSV